MRTKLQAGIFSADFLTRVVGEEHVGRQTTLWCIGVCRYCQSETRTSWSEGRVPFFLPFPVSALVRVLRVVVVLASFGILGVAVDL